MDSSSSAPHGAHGAHPADANGHARVFYDGTCGLCHRAVRFYVRRDRAGRFRFAPLEGETFRRRVGEAERAGLPDSLVVQTPDGRLLTRARGTLYMLEQLGGPWRLLSGVGRVVPLRLLDALYDLVARNRLRWFRRPSTSCPLLPPELRDRFED